MSTPPRCGAEIPAFHPSSRKNGFMGVTPTPPAPCQPTDPPPGSASSLLDSSIHPPTPSSLTGWPFSQKRCLSRSLYTMAGGEHLSLKLLQDRGGQHDVGSLSTEQSSRPALGIGSSKVWDQPLGKCRATVWKGGRNQSPNWNISKCSFVKQRRPA